MAIEDIVINVTAQQIEAMAKRQISQEITEDSSAEELASAKAVYDAVKNASGGDDAEVMRVYFNEGDMTANYTSHEIAEHVLGGGFSYMVIGDMRIPFSRFDIGTELAHFGYCSPQFNGGVKLPYLQDYFVDANGNADSSLVFVATQADIGNISSALDTLHTYAQELINGGATE